MPQVTRRNFKTRLVVFTNKVLLLLDVRLWVYSEKRQKTKLICLQYATFQQRLLSYCWKFQQNLSNFSQHGSKSDNQGDLKTPIEAISNLYAYLAEATG